MNSTFSGFGVFFFEQSMMNKQRGGCKRLPVGGRLFDPCLLADESDASYAESWGITVMIKGDYESGAGEASVKRY